MGEPENRNVKVANGSNVPKKQKKKTYKKKYPKLIRAGQEV